MRRDAKPAAAKPQTPWQKWSAQPDAIGDLCTHVMNGGHAAEFCEAHSVQYPTLIKWLDADDERRKLYERAREDRADKIADEIVAISDEMAVEVRHEGEAVTLALDATAIARNRLRVDARKWVASKLKPKRYGDKMAVGGDPDAPPIGFERIVREIIKAK